MENKKRTAALVVIAAGIILITAGLMIAVPGDYLTTYESLGGKDGYSYIREYVGGDAYNYIMGASLVAGHISGTMAMKAVFIAVGVLVTCMGFWPLPLSPISQSPPRTSLRTPPTRPRPQNRSNNARPAFKAPLQGSSELPWRGALCLKQQENPLAGYRADSQPDGEVPLRTSVFLFRASIC